MKTKLATISAALVAAVSLVMALTPAFASAPAANTAMSQSGPRTLCRSNQHMVAHTHQRITFPGLRPGGRMHSAKKATPGPQPSSPQEKIIYSGPRYIVRDAYWLGERAQCITNQDATTNFAVTQKAGWDPGHQVIAYPDIYRGCMWNVCSPRAGLPRRVRAVGDPRLTAHFKAGVFGMYNSSFDVRFLKTSSHTGQADGAELMIWLGRHGGCCGLQPGAPRIKVEGRWYWYSHWRTCSHLASQPHVCWNYIQFRRVHQTRSVSGLRLAPFIHRAERSGLVKPRWWMQTIEAGFEIWTGGKGLAVTKFRATGIGRR